MANVFGADDNQPVDYLAYATERYKNDAGELDLNKIVRAVYEKDKHITNVEGENAELRGEVNTRIGLEEFLTKMNKPNEEGNANPPGNQPQPLSQPEPVDIEKLVQSTLDKAEADRVKKRNQQAVNDALDRIWGADAGKKFQQTALALGMGTDELKTIAERSPEAFFRLAGVNTSQNKPPVGNAPSGSVNLGISGGNEVRNHAYYQKLKKTDPKSYFSTRTQMQMHQDANTLGEKFFN